jgi:hypothetical protein
MYLTERVLINAAALRFPRRAAIGCMRDDTLQLLGQGTTLVIAYRPPGILVDKKYIVETRLPIRTAKDFPLSRFRFTIGPTTARYKNQNPGDNQQDSAI